MAFNCEFNAPQFFDFESAANPLHDGDQEDAEKYFEFDHENKIPLDAAPEETDDSAAQAAAEAPTASSDSASDGQPAAGLPTASGSAEEPVSTSSSTSSPAPTTLGSLLNQSRQDTPNRKGLREAVSKTLEQVSNSPKVALPPRRRSQQVGTPSAKATSAATATSLSGKKPATPKRLGVIGSGDQNKKAPSPALSRWRNAVKQMTPEILRKARQARQAKAASKTSAAASATSSSGLASNFKAVLANSRRLAAQTTQASQAKADAIAMAHKSASASASASAATSTGMLKNTMPAPFNFATDARQHHHHHHQPQQQKPVKGERMDFSKMLRNYSGTTSETQPQQHQRQSRTTQPKSFNLSTQQRQRQRPRASSCEPTPNRQRRPSNGSVGVGGGSGSGTNLAQSSENVSGPRRPTEVKPFSFVDRDLAKSREKAGASKELNFGKSLRDYPSQEGLATTAAPTKPKPFSFDARSSNPRRRRSRSVDRATSSTGEERRARDPLHNVIKARPAPHFGVPVTFNAASRKTTVSQPFSFAQRDQLTLQRKQERIDSILEQEKREREFKANPMPNLSKPVGLPIKEVLLPTEPKPFSHEIEKRVETRVQKWQDDVEDELRRQREQAAAFRARAPAVLHKEPFVPLPSDKPLAEVGNFELHSDRRAAERENFEQEKKQREAELEARKRQLEDRRRLEEEENVKRLRLEAVHKAQPVRQFKSVEIRSSEKPLTTPASPKFSQLPSQRRVEHTTTTTTKQ